MKTESLLNSVDSFSYQKLSPTTIFWSGKELDNRERKQTPKSKQNKQAQKLLYWYGIKNSNFFTFLLYINLYILTL